MLFESVMGFVVVVIFAGCIGVETLRWWARPEARRLRHVRKVDRVPRV